MTLDEFTWTGDIVSTVADIRVVYSGNLAHLMEDVTIDYTQVEGESTFIVRTKQTDAC